MLVNLHDSRRELATPSPPLGVVVIDLSFFFQPHSRTFVFSCDLSCFCFLLLFPVKGKAHEVQKIGTCLLFRKNCVVQQVLKAWTSQLFIFEMSPTGTRIPFTSVLWWLLRRSCSLLSQIAFVQQVSSWSFAAVYVHPSSSASCEFMAPSSSLKLFRPESYSSRTLS